LPLTAIHANVHPTPSQLCCETWFRAGPKMPTAMHEADTDPERPQLAIPALLEAPKRAMETHFTPSPLQLASPALLDVSLPTATQVKGPVQLKFPAWLLAWLVPLIAMHDAPLLQPKSPASFRAGPVPLTAMHPTNPPHDPWFVALPVPLMLVHCGRSPPQEPPPVASPVRLMASTRPHASDPISVSMSTSEPQSALPSSGAAMAVPERMMTDARAITTNVRDTEGLWSRAAQ